MTTPRSRRVVEEPRCPEASEGFNWARDNTTKSFERVETQRSYHFQWESQKRNRPKDRVQNEQRRKHPNRTSHNCSNKWRTCQKKVETSKTKSQWKEGRSFLAGKQVMFTELDRTSSIKKKKKEEEATEVPATSEAAKPDVVVPPPSRMTAISGYG